MAGSPRSTLALRLWEADVTIPVYGLYKNDKHQTEGIIDQNEKTYPLGQ
jgi:hypothetical protein